MWTCRACGAESPEGKRFCADCGAPLTLACPSCGSPIEPGKRFCGDCGTPLTGDAGSENRAPVFAAGLSSAGPGPRTQVAERRVCSVLFADLVGFTPLSESRDPEEVRELLSRYFDELRRVIGRYGGVVEKFIGDAVMAVWGTPVATEGDAERAVRAALDIVEVVRTLGEQIGAPDLAARAGVVTGEVAATRGLEGEGVAGDTVNTASRVQSVAKPGSVWVDSSTYRLAGAAIAFGDAGEHRLKGKAESVRLWAATRVLSGVGGAQREDGLEAPLLGRDAELRAIKELFHASGERKTARLVVVSGPAGVGKSRLAWEFEKYIDGLADTMYWHRGRCLSYGEGVVFWALTEIVRQRFGIAEEDPLDVAARKLVDGLRTFVKDDAERKYVGPRLGRLLGINLPDDAGGHLPREELFAGWRVFFERLAEVHPVVLLVEDAQYGDAALLDFLDYLVDWARDSPIYVLVFSRPELERIRPGFGTGRNRSTLTLDPLDDASMDALIDALVPGMPAEARAAIRSQAEGIPLFAVETVRSLVDRDIVVPRDGVYTLVGELGTLSVPAGLHALLAARLDGLDSHLRSLVAEAAVLGSTFPADALVAVSAQPAESVRAGLVQLLRREVLSISADRLSPQRGDYRFSQDLLRQVAYETLSRRDRKARHLAVAAHMRSAFPADGDEVAEVISRHYLDALAAVPDAADVPEIRAEAIGMLVRAADRALRAGAPRPAALNYASAAQQTELTAAEDGPGGAALLAAARLWEQSARAALAADLEDALAYSERASELYAGSGESRASARAQAVAGEHLRRRGRHGAARERLVAALEVLRPEPDADTVATLNQLATVEIFSARPEADQDSAEALILGQALDVDHGLLADLFIVRSIALGFTNRYAEAIAHLEYAARLAEGVGDSARQARALHNLGELLNHSDPRAAAAASRKASDLARHCGNALYLMVAIENEAEGLILIGDWDEADAVLRDSLESDDNIAFVACILQSLRGDPDSAAAQAALPRMRVSEDTQDRVCVQLVDALIASARNLQAEALSHARSSLQQIGGIGVGHFLAQIGWPLATRTAFTVGDTGAVTELLALLDAHPIGHLPPLLRAERVLARARLAEGAGDPGTSESFVAAVAALRQAGSPYHLAHGLLDQAEHLFRRESDGALGLIVEAREIAERLRARQLLDRANQLEARAPEGVPTAGRF